MSANPLVGQLFSLNGGEPAPLPDRVYLGRVTAYLNAEAEQGNMISAADLAEHGYTGPIEKPAYDVNRQAVVWDGAQYIVADLSDELRTSLWAKGRAVLDAKIAELNQLADLRAAQLTSAGASTAAVDAFRTRLQAAEAATDCPMEVVLPSTALLSFENNPAVPHPRSREWCMENWASDVDRGYMSEQGGEYFEITNEETYRNYLEANKEAINLYALGQEFQALVYPTAFTDNLNRTGTVTVELAGDAIGYTYSVDGGADQIQTASELTFTLSGSGEHSVNFVAVSDNGEGASYTHSFYIQ